MKYIIIIIIVAIIIAGYFLLQKEEPISFNEDTKETCKIDLGDSLGFIAPEEATTCGE